MKIKFVSMRKYKMRLPLLYKIKRMFTFEKLWSGQIWQFRFMCTYGFDGKTLTFSTEEVAKEVADQFFSSEESYIIVHVQP